MMLFFMVGVLSLSSIGIYSYYNAKRALLKRTLDQLTSIRVIKKDQVHYFLKEKFNKLKLLSESYSLISLVSEITTNSSLKISAINSANNLNHNVFGPNDMLIVIGATKENLKIYIINEAIITRITPDSASYQQLVQLWDQCKLTPELSIVDFKKKFINNNDSQCYIGTRINIPSNQLSCILALPISTKEINSIMLEDSQDNGLGKSGEVYLVGDDYLMRSSSRFIPNSVLNTKVKTISSTNAFKDQVGSSLIDDYRTIKCLSSYDRLNISGLNWAIIAEIDYNEAMIPIVSIRNDIVFISLVICVLLFSISHIISKTITKPIIKLKNVALKIGEGELDINLKPKSKDEIGLLYNAFNTMAEQLKEEHLKRMTALYDGQELERQRISRELHDGLGQKLIAIKLQLESTSKQNMEETRTTLEEVKGSFLKIIEEVRQISNNLAPNILNDSGLDIALKNLCDSVEKTSKINIEFSVHGDVNTPDPKVKFYVYRIAQEALNNSVKHSSASQIQMQLIGNSENIILVIEDNGKGFVYDNQFCKPCNGLFNMRERASLLNGTIDIETELLSGTTIRLKVPRMQH